MKIFFSKEPISGKEIRTDMNNNNNINNDCTKNVTFKKESFFARTRSCRVLRNLHIKLFNSIKLFNLHIKLFNLQFFTKKLAHPELSF